MKKFLQILFLTIFNQLLFSQVKVDITVIAPGLTDTEKVFISGNYTTLGDWNPGVISLDRINDSTWNKAFKFRADSKLEFKFTKGDWGKEALDGNEKAPGNLMLTVTNDTSLTYHINQWGSKHLNINGKITGQIKYHLSFQGKNILPRDIMVWLPPGYDSLPNKKYPVLYMQDGQNVFDPSTSSFGVDWQIDETADSLINSKSIEDIIIVGIYNTIKRRVEYSRSDTGYFYMKFVVDELKPFIDSNYRTLTDRENTAVCGSSLGGLISFMLLWEYSDVFSKAACFSPAFNIDNKYDLDFVSPVINYSGPKKDIKIYIYNGGIGLEEKIQVGIDKMLTALKDKGYELNKDIIWEKENSAEHNESAWGKKVYQFLEYFFPKR
jgi:predicted alpha/beta superfamily hydrolase